METPEHVYTSILLLKSVASDKSGVLVTQDLDTGDREVVSVAVNEGVGGAVDGQAAESLRIDTRDGSVRMLATATAPWLRKPAAGGGIEKLPASGADSVLQPAEIGAPDPVRQGRTAQTASRPSPTTPATRPPPTSSSASSTAQLRLFQIRPFLESRSARGNAYLVDMDKSLQGNLDRTVNLSEVPAS